MEKLNRYNHEMLMMGGYEGKNPKEALWKTPDVEKKLRSQIDEMGKKLTEEASKTQTNMKNLFDIISQMHPKEDISKIKNDDES